MNTVEEKVEEYKRRRKEDPRYLKYKGSKAIPFSFHMGFYTVSVGSPAFENLKNHWHHHVMPHNAHPRIHGICFGSKKNNHIQLEQSFQFRYDAYEKIIIDNNQYNTDFEFLGVYSNGDFPDDMDISILQVLCQIVKHSVFLLKFTWSDELNNVLSTLIFENVLDICRNDFETRIICLQAFNHHPHESLINNNLSNDNAEKIFYITFYDKNFACFTRYDLDINDDQKRQLKETAEMFNILPTFEDYKYTIFKVAYENKLRFQDLFNLRGEDYLKKAKEFAAQAKVDLRFNFTFSLDCDEVNCIVWILNFQTCGCGSKLRESLYNGTANFLRTMAMGDYLKNKDFSLIKVNN